MMNVPIAAEFCEMTYRQLRTWTRAHPGSSSNPSLGHSLRNARCADFRRLRSLPNDVRALAEVLVVVQLDRGAERSVAAVGTLLVRVDFE